MKFFAIPLQGSRGRNFFVVTPRGRSDENGCCSFRKTQLESLTSVTVTHVHAFRNIRIACEGKVGPLLRSPWHNLSNAEAIQIDCL